MPDDVVALGHGQPITRRFGLAQLTQFEVVTARVEDVHAAGATSEQALRRRR